MTKKKLDVVIWLDPFAAVDNFTSIILACEVQTLTRACEMEILIFLGEGRDFIHRQQK
jgi:hypothetical protein